MAGHSLTLSRIIQAPISRVWDVLTALESFEEVLSGVIEIERVSGTGYEVGTRWRETRKMFGKQQTLEMWVSELDPPHRMVIHAVGGPVSYSTEFTLEPHGDDTELIMRFAAQHESASGGRSLHLRTHAHRRPSNHHRDRAPNGDYERPWGVVEHPGQQLVKRLAGPRRQSCGATPLVGLGALDVRLASGRRRAAAGRIPLGSKSIQTTQSEGALRN